MSIGFSFLFIDKKTTIVCLLIAGEWSDLEQVYESSQHGIPVLVCENTGKLADLLAQAKSNRQMYARLSEYDIEHVAFSRERSGFKRRNINCHEMMLTDNRVYNAMKTLSVDKEERTIDDAIRKVKAICDSNLVGGYCNWKHSIQLFRCLHFAFRVKRNWYQFCWTAS